MVETDAGRQLQIHPAPTAQQITALGSTYRFYYYAGHVIGAEATETSVPVGDRGVLLLRAQVEAMRELAMRGTGKHPRHGDRPAAQRDAGGPGGAADGGLRAGDGGGAMKVQISHNAREVRQAIAKKPRAVMAALDRKMGRGAQEVAREARRGAPKAESLLTNSIHVFRHGEADYSVFAGQEYAPYVEGGTGPGGTPPDQSLEDWIRVQGITPRDPDMDMDDLVYVIGRSIREHGTPAQPFMGPALDKTRDRLAVLHAQGVAEGLRA